MSRQDGILSETLDKFLFEETLTGEQRSTIRNQIGVAASLGSVADAAERKNPASYPNGIDVGQTRVVQANLPGIIWTLVDADVTQDSSWIGQPYTVDPNGEIIVSMELAEVSGTVPAVGELGRVGLQRVVMGDGITPGGVKVGRYDSKVPGACFQLPIASSAARSRAAFFTSTRSTAITCTVRSNSGYARLVNFDGTLGPIYGNGSASTDITLTGATPTAPFNTAIPKFYAIYGCDLNGFVYDSDFMVLTRITLSGNQVTFFDGRNLAYLNYLSLTSNLLSVFDGTGMSSLTDLRLSTNYLREFDGSDLSSLQFLRMSSNLLTKFDGAGMTSLKELYLDLNPITRFDGSQLGALTYLSMDSNKLTSFSAFGLYSLVTLMLTSNNIASFNGNGLTANLQFPRFDYAFLGLKEFSIGDTGWVPYDNVSYALPLNNQLLNAQAIQGIYESLPLVIGSGRTHTIDVTGNPGAGAGSGTNPAVATAKGWVVMGDTV